MKIALFIDGANLYYTQKHILNWFLDFRKLLKFVSEKGEVVIANYYIGVEDKEENKSEAFLHLLPEMGYSVITKPIKTIVDGETGSPKKKANLDIEIVLDMFNSLEHYDTAILVSGDGDFLRAIDLLKARGKQVWIISSEGSVAREIRQIQGANFIDLKDHKKQLFRNQE